MKNKNKSKIISNGRTLQTRDEFLFSGKNYKKQGYENKGLYRKVVVVDSNKNNELAIIKLTTKGKHKLPNYQNGKSTYNAFIEIKDNKNKPIKIGKKFILNNKKSAVSIREVNSMKKNSLLFASNKTKKRNRKALKILKKR